MLEKVPPATTEVPTPTGPQEPSLEQQNGVRIAEAVTKSWSKSTLIQVYICMWLMYFVRALNGSLTSNLAPYITSDFSNHSLLPVIQIVVSIMSAACTMPIAKLLNLWDRTVALSLMLVVAIIGLIVMACCHNITIYCVAQAFITVGLTGLIFSLDVLTADTSTAQDRALAFAFTSSPYIIMAFAGAPLSASFNGLNWRWAYGTIAILLPAVTVPLIIIWELAKRKAQQTETLTPVHAERSLIQHIRYYLIEFDIMGILLLIAGFSLFLLAFALAGSQPQKWHSTHIICMIVIGGVTIIVFAAYERFFASKPLVPYNLLVSRTVTFTCLLNLTYVIAADCWASYFTSFLQVVYHVSLTEAGYVVAISNLISPLWLVGVGFLVRWTGRFKWLLLCAIPVYLLAIGLMIYFRSPGHSIGYICLCETAVTTATEHNDYASMLALLGWVGSIGGAIGNSISGAIWTNTLPQKLREYLPDDTKAQWKEINDSLYVQLSYEVGSPTRVAIERAYAVSQRNMLIAGIAFMALTVVWVLGIKDVRVKGRDNKGRVLF
ncbi:siderophore iron transporter mirB [Aspergillus nomiae NRRL 13137]|uniref:Siderophore iron transporter mirB n=1 Tax=Aspergillus nomiae NRRL (strain ATCC 15546 / NRRL 13137 / CBS 260.88 / M93) TaxID=1509407 RepID=A0A0L1JIN4_ASPN3|nr:siderophore iron transporter mirB [Aspergillus nomiae NRRL 13137]KNG91630.1 siderophore iron transporter mirB [Aspergillus nomiae NRRL 13137]